MDPFVLMFSYFGFIYKETEHSVHHSNSTLSFKDLFVLVMTIMFGIQLYAVLKHRIIFELHLMPFALQIGTPICVPSREFTDIGRIASIENNHKPVDYAKKGQRVAIKVCFEPCLRYGASVFCFLCPCSFTYFWNNLQLLCHVSNLNELIIMPLISLYLSANRFFNMELSANSSHKKCYFNRMHYFHTQKKKRESIVQDAVTWNLKARTSLCLWFACCILGKMMNNIYVFWPINYYW